MSPLAAETNRPFVRAESNVFLLRSLNLAEYVRRREQRDTLAEIAKTIRFAACLPNVFKMDVVVHLMSRVVLLLVECSVAWSVRSIRGVHQSAVFRKSECSKSGR